ncbi:senescence-associated carboxylesterase 101 [Prunus yedoensis var. nudiflora]|uniref:Senescence-associated carboxylesterase 101 n=1 Tax=Prunus yedoensis var. nudiflora TaxID=2094558 RepID=A0A314XZ05_PRUYE|nr:senescence-associated carboxylesterase 101 [Prunus yedoensis var. nudiflora]
MSNQFSSGLELANVLLTSEPLHQSWYAIQNDKQRVNPNAQATLHINTTQQANLTIITFLTSPMPLRGQEGLILSSTFNQRNLPDFEFLCNKSNPSFSINEAAIKLFASCFDELCLLKTEICRSNSLVIITGHSMGGCVATLFTLWLLESLNLSKAKRPLCITFGSPLIGDEHLRKCVSQFPNWTSCFLHVASIQDPVPKLFLSQIQLLLEPDPDSILMLVAANSQGDQTQDPNVGIQFFDYGQLLEPLKHKAFCKDVFELAESDRVPLKASIITQLAAIFGVPQSQALQQQQPYINILIKNMEKHEYKLAIQKTKTSNAAKKLNDIKVSMVYLEWYKKDSKSREIGYYDMYKNKRYRSDINVEEYKKKLSNYWQDSVEEVENKPQKEGAAFRTRWLMGGTTYRRMMEPLHIAEYYKDKDGKNYREERPKHFILLEKWLKEEEERKVAERIGRGETVEDGPSKSKAQNVASSLTDDSCFVAHVEEALILCNQLENGQQSVLEREQCKKKLIEFEEYVLDALKNFAVTPDIFLKHSSFMAWWEQYKGSATTQLARIMNDRTYRDYEKGVQVVF